MGPEDDIFDLWDVYHPADSDDFLFPQVVDEEELAPLPQIPTMDLIPDVVDYSARGPGDFVISGPLVGGDRIQGRRFDSVKAAYLWGVKRYGKSRVSVVVAGELRWALLIKANK